MHWIFIGILAAPFVLGALALLCCIVDNHIDVKRSRIRRTEEGGTANALIDKLRR